MKFFLTVEELLPLFFAVKMIKILGTNFLKCCLEETGRKLKVKRGKAIFKQRKILLEILSKQEE